MEEYSTVSAQALNTLSQARDSLSAIISMMEDDESNLGAVRKETAAYALSAVKNLAGVIQQSPKQLRMLRACIHSSTSAQPSAE